MTDNEKREWLDLGAGLGLLVPKYSTRMKDAMLKVELCGSPADLEHVTALALVELIVRGEDVKWVQEIWHRLSRSFHENDCVECERTMGRTTK